MKTWMTFMLLFAATSASWAQTPPSCKTSMTSNALVDDFTSGQGPLYAAPGLSYATAVSNTWFSNVTQIGDSTRVMGGMRGMAAQVTANYLSQPFKADVIASTSPSGGSALAVTAGVREGFGIYGFYGVDTARGVSHPLGLKFPAGSTCDRIRIWFDSNLASLHVVYEVKQTGDPAWYVSGMTIGPQPSNAAPFCLDIPFSSYFPAGVAQTFTASGIDGMALNIGSGNVALGDSFAISKVEFADKSTAACLYSVP